MHLEITWNAYLQIKWELNKVAWRIFFIRKALNRGKVTHTWVVSLNMRTQTWHQMRQLRIKVKEPNNLNITPQFTERSIHSAYIEAIRTSEYYVYIENQFFVSWLNEKTMASDIQAASLNSSMSPTGLESELQPCLVKNTIAQALYDRILRAYKYISCNSYCFLHTIPPYLFLRLHRLQQCYWYFSLLLDPCFLISYFSVSWVFLSHSSWPAMQISERSHREYVLRTHESELTYKASVTL